jgi:protein-serine/threonine kinase
MQGISPDTRAFAALHSKALAAVPSPEADGKNEPTISLAVDLVMRCLEIDPLNRPTADMICDHAFLVGQEEGWQGERGWENVDRED